MIKKAKETMSSRERVKRTFDFEKTDRVTIGYEANSLINSKFLNELGIKPHELFGVLGVDYMGVLPVYTGEKLFEDIPDRLIHQEFGCVMRWVPNSSGGGYFDYCDFPLKDADDEKIMNFPIPNPDDYDYDSVGDIIKKNRDMAIYIGNPGFGCVINNMGWIMGMEDALINIQCEHEPTLHYLNRQTQWFLGTLERILSRYKGEIDFMWLGEDLGTQIAPMISMEKYRKII
jgi:uroporphyrinogen decarboxylase